LTFWIDDEVAYTGIARPEIVIMRMRNDAANRRA